jgi:hypothetical protein
VFEGAIRTPAWFGIAERMVFNMAKSSKSNQSSRSSGNMQENEGRSQRRSSGRDNQSGRFPLDNLSFDLITIVHEKSKALEAYDRYLEDAEDEPEIRRALEQIQDQERQSIEMLRRHLGRVLGQQGQRAA